MKIRLSFFMLGLLGWSMANAGPVELERAVRQAEEVLGKAVFRTTDETAKVRARMGTETAAPAFYVFNAEDGKGFVIISGDDQMPEVVAYAHEGRFNASNMHPELAGMLGYYTEVVEEVRRGETTVSRTPRRAKATPVVGPLCPTKWGQEEPYNTLCPQKDGENCPTGCVATAMAQIMYHFAWPKVGTGSGAYASGISGVGLLRSNFSEHYYAWDVMGKTNEENLASQEAADAVAQLCYDCGVATRMEYDPAGSGTNDDLAMAALYTYFGYKASTLDIRRRDCYATQEEWNDMVKAELHANRPVLYAGFSSQAGGHEFIIDGYDSEDNFRVNWGWDGDSNGYYSIITLNPTRTKASFSANQSAVCGIEPDETGEDKTPQQWRIYMVDAPTVEVEQVELGKYFMVKFGTFFNYSRTANTWTIGAALYDLEGNQKQILTSTSSKGDNTQQLLSYYGYGQLGVTARLAADIPDGYYMLRAVFRQTGYKQFVLPDVVGGSDRNKVYVQVKEGVAYFNAEIPSAIEEMEAEDSRVVSHQYYDLSGKPLRNATKGIVLDQQRLSNGKQIVKKVRL